MTKFSNSEIKSFYNEENCISTCNFNEVEAYILFYNFKNNPLYKNLETLKNVEVNFKKIQSNIIKNNKYLVDFELDQDNIDNFFNNSNEDIKIFSLKTNFSSVYLIYYDNEKKSVLVEFYSDFILENKESQFYIFGFFINNPNIFTPIFDLGRIELTNFNVGIIGNGKLIRILLLF